jgi:O-6-methylguanine DNA methyltransferase
MPDRAFTTRVLSVVRRIPPGRVASYGEVAALAGRPRAARAVGNIMRTCGRVDVPCHRVIAAGGRLGGYGGSEALKRSLLAAEGVVVAGSRIRNLDRVRWTDARYRSSRPELAPRAGRRRRPRSGRP